MIRQVRTLLAWVVLGIGMRLLPEDDPDYDWLAEAVHHAQARMEEERGRH
jgi:hypothetical protein